MWSRGRNGLYTWIEDAVGQPAAASAIELIYRTTGRVKLSDMYVMILGEYKGFLVCIWDGTRTCRLFYPPWVMGGNHQRYRFNPLRHIVLDSRIPIEEFFFTLEHEVVECEKMEKLGWSYARAHREGGLVLERELREQQFALIQAKERSLSPGVLGRWGKPKKSNGKDITVDLRGVYRNYFGKFDGLDVYLVDAGIIRRRIETDFTFSGHDLEFDFIPDGEGWVDASSPVAEGFYHLIEMLTYRRSLLMGMSRSDAYDNALAVKAAEYNRQATLCREMEASLDPVRFGVRERGAKKR